MKERAPGERPDEGQQAAPVRAAALAVLAATLRGGKHADAALEARAAPLAEIDRPLLYELVYGVLRRLRLLDALVAMVAREPMERLAAGTLDNLRLAALQILFLERIPPYAATNDAVTLARRQGRAGVPNVVNALCRRFASERDTLLARVAGLPAPVRHSHPDWIAERWVRSFGRGIAEALMAADNEHPAAYLAIDLRRLSRPEAIARLAAEGVVAEEAGEAPTAIRVVAGSWHGSSVLAEHLAYPQDAASQAVAALVTAAAQARIVDLAAAPGGKALDIAFRQPTVRLVACELAGARLALLRRTLTAFGARAQLVASDATRPAFASAIFDVALLDAPCSGTGTLRRNPDLRWRLRATALAQLAARQRSMLSGALDLVRPGGEVVYSTCSLEPEENEDVVAAVLGERGDAELVSLADRLPAALRGCLQGERRLRLLPTRGTDGFTVHVLRRAATMEPVTTPRI